MQQKSIFKNFIYKSILSFFNIIVPIILGSYVNRALGKTSLGTVTFTDKIHQYFLIFASFGIYSYGLREISKVKEDQKQLKSTFSSLLLISIISTTLMLLIYTIFVFVNYRSTDNYYLFLIFSISIFSNLFYVEWANEALEKYGFITTKTICIKIIYIIALLSLIKEPKHNIIYALILTLSTFLNNIVSFVSIVKNIGFTFKEIKIKKHLPYLFITLIMANGNFLYTQLDAIFLGSNIGYGAVSIYTIPLNIICMINALIMSVVFVTLPRLSNLLSNNDELGYKNLLNKSYTSLCMFLFPSAIGIFVLGREILLLYGGIEYLPAIPVIKIFTVYMITTAIDAVIANQIIYAKKREKALICFVLVCGLTNLIIKLTLSKIGLLTPCSAIATTIICNLILIALEYVYSIKILKTKLEIFKMSNLKYLFISLLFVPISYVIKLFVSSTLFIALITVLTCCAFYFLILLITKDEVVITVLNKFFNKYFSLIKKDGAVAK